MHIDFNSLQMKDIANEEGSKHGLAHSTPTSLFSPWWNSNTSYNPDASFSKNLTLNVALLAQQHGNLVKQSRQVPDQDSSSTQSTSKSQQEVSEMSEGNAQEQHSSPQSGSAGANKPVDHLKACSGGSSEAAFAPQKPEYNQPFACIPYPCSDPYFGGVMAAYGSHTIIHPQMAGLMTSGRVPLPLETATDEPIYVNAKQYGAIMRRRQLRAKLEAQNKLVKNRKPYLHESRHLHAMKRARGSGGRFLNRKELESSSGSQTVSGSKPSSHDATNSSGQQDHWNFNSPSLNFGVGLGIKGGGSTISNSSEHRIVAIL